MKNTVMILMIVEFMALLVVSGALLFNAFLAEPLSYPVQPFLLDKDAYKYGDDMVVNSYRCNTQGVPLAVHTTSREFFNLGTGVSIHRTPGAGIVQPGCGWAFAVAYNPFPDDMPSGKYILRGTTEAQGRFKTVDVQWQSEPFDYTGKDSSK